MNLPPEIESLIKQYAQPCAATTRPNWEQGSSIIEVLKHDRWWEHYNYDRLLIDTFIGHDEETVAQDTTNTWYAWCKYKRIIGPPRCVSSGDIEQLDCDYLYITGGLARHYIPWTRTWFGVSEMALRQSDGKRNKEYP